MLEFDENCNSCVPNVDSYTTNPFESISTRRDLNVRHGKFSSRIRVRISHQSLRDIQPKSDNKLILWLKTMQQSVF